MTIPALSLEHVHADSRTARAGEPTRNAARAMILVHGRGATPDSILALADELPRNLGFSFVAPGASESTAHPRSWYPHSFLAPVEANEPGLSSGLAKVAETVAQLETSGIEPGNIILLGFSQGACLVTEFTARNPRRWGGIAALTGGLIGEIVTPSNNQGDLEGTPVLLGSSDRDPHVPLWRVEESERVLRRMGADVDLRIYPGMPHTINADELEWVAGVMRGVRPVRVA